MESDFSKQLYEKYFSCDNRLIEVTLKNRRKITGAFISFFLGKKHSNEPYINNWHIVNEKYKMSLGIDSFGYLIGEIINQNDIESINFLDDNSVMTFK
ncbi:MAG: hypothetical protein ABI851_07910 [Saprospiraceae bacterium]